MKGILIDENLPATLRLPTSLWPAIESRLANCRLIEVTESHLEAYD